MKLIKIIQIIAIIVFLICIGYLAKIYFGYQKSDLEYQQLRTYISTIAMPKEETKTETKIEEQEDIPDLKVDFKELKKLNSEIKAWIIACGGKISYPIVQGEDNSYYLNHSYTKEKSASGCIFIDSFQNGNFEDFHTILYGHHMKDGTMFTPLIKYKEKEYWEKNRYIYVYTEDRAIQYEICSVYTEAASKLIFNADYSKKKEKEELINEISKGSIYEIPITAPFVSDVLTLITCDYTGEDYRFIVHTKKVKEK